MECYQRLKNLRTDSDLTQEKMGEIIGVSQRTISHYESGKREPGLTEIKRYAKYFKVSTDYIMCLTDEPTPQYSTIKNQNNIYNNYGNINNS